MYALFMMQIRHIKLRRSLYYSWYTILSITNPTPLKNNLVPEISKKEDILILVHFFQYPFFAQVLPWVFSVSSHLLGRIWLEKV